MSLTHFASLFSLTSPNVAELAGMIAGTVVILAVVLTAIASMMGRQRP